MRKISGFKWILLLITSNLLFFTTNVFAATTNEISLTVTGTINTSANVDAEQPCILDVCSTLDSSVANPVFEVNVPINVKINKFTLPKSVDSSAGSDKLDKVELINKDTNVSMGSNKGIVDDSTQNRILRFTIIPGTSGPVGFNVEVTPNMRYTLPTENFILYGELFNGITKIHKSVDFTIKAKNRAYQVLILNDPPGRGSVEQGKIARYGVGIMTFDGGQYGNPIYMPDAVVKIPLPNGAEYVDGSGGSDVEYVAKTGLDPAYILLKNWPDTVKWREDRLFAIKYPGVAVGTILTGQPMTLTYTHGGREQQTITQPTAIHNKIIASQGDYSTIWARTYKYKIGYDCSPFLTLGFYNELEHDITNFNYDITIPNQLKVRGLNAVETHLTNTSYADLTFTTNTARIITKKISTQNYNFTPADLGLLADERIIKINVFMTRVPVGFSLCDYDPSNTKEHKGFVLYGTTASGVADGTVATISIKEHSDLESVSKETLVKPELYDNIYSPVKEKIIGPATARAGEDVEINHTIYYGSSASPWETNCAYYEVINPTIYYIIPKGFTVDTSNIKFLDEFNGKTPNIYWSPGTIPANPLDTNFPNGAGVLKIEFDGSTPEKSITLRGTDEYFNQLNKYAKVKLTLQVLESLDKGDYNFQPCVWVETQNSKGIDAWGSRSQADIYDLNGNGNITEKITAIKTMSYPGWISKITIMRPPDIYIITSLESRLTGEDNVVEFFSGDNGKYSFEIRNELSFDTTNAVAYIPVPKRGDTLTDKDGNIYNQNWTPQITSITSTEKAALGLEPHGVEVYYSTSAVPTKNELAGGADSDYTLYSGGAFPANIRMIKLKIAQLHAATSVKLSLGIEAADTPDDTELCSYIASDYKFNYQGETQSQTKIKTLKLIAYNIGGRAFIDKKQGGGYNGAYDVGEPAAKHMKVTLYNSGTVVKEVYTDDFDGKYNFIIKEPGQYKIKADINPWQKFTDFNPVAQGSKVDPADGTYDFVLDQNTTKKDETVNIGYINLATFDASSFTDRVTGRNKWVLDIAGEPINQKYNWYNVNKGEEIITRLTINDIDGIEYDNIRLEYNLNSEVPIVNDQIVFNSSRVIKIREKSNPTNLITTYSSSASPDKDKLSINIPNFPKEKDIEVFVRYKINKKNSSDPLTNTLLGNQVTIYGKKGPDEFIIKKVDIKWTINLRDIKIILG